MTNNKFNSIMQLSDFRGFWRSSSQYPIENSANNHVHMPVDVIYEWGNGKSKIEFSSEFRAFVGSGPDDGQVDIDETEKVRIEDFHLRFNPAFQNYAFDEEKKCLIVSGSSPKMGGDYTLRIMPSLEEP